jgi:hypothetical protein
LVAWRLPVSEDETGQIFEETTRRKHTKTEMTDEIFLLHQLEAMFEKLPGVISFAKAVVVFVRFVH